MNTQNSPTSGPCLPGCGRPVNYIPRDWDTDYSGELFPNALSTLSFNRAALPLTTIREFTMMQFMNAITDKVEWNLKVNDAQITAKWKQEALDSGTDITEKMIDWCLDELRHKASSIIEGYPQPPTVVYNGNVVKSDHALSAEFKSALQHAVEQFENRIPEHQRDWHPGSDRKVWDLVHPSLFPVVYGRSRILVNGDTVGLEDCVSRCGQGMTLALPPENESREVEPTGREGYAYIGHEDSYSLKFQWLPCEVDITQDKASVTSYINNLHPLNEKPLYGLIEQLIDASIPLWDLTLAPLHQSSFHHQLRIIQNNIEYLSDRGIASENVQDDNDDNEDTGNDSDGSWHSRTDTENNVVRPEPEGSFSPLASPPKFSLREEYGQRGLQVIVKLANIQLTPENPQYDGGSWHIEGQLNEHIVATALYYYSSSNITTSTLSFRQWCDEEAANEIMYRQNHSAWLRVLYGLERDEAAVQDVGSINTHEGRLLTFPNILQHRVDPFKLADPTQPGHRKIVALFLVDPHIKIISSANVPCQRQDWWREASQLEKGPGNIMLPLELQDKILEDVDFPIGLAEAKELREELMGQRREFKAQHDDVISKSFVVSLCEH